MRQTTTITKTIGHGALFGAALMIAGALTLLIQPPTAQACDACNNAFMNQLEGDRSDTLLGREYRQMRENHAQFDTLTFDFGEEAATSGGDAAEVVAQADTDTRQGAVVAQAPGAESAAARADMPAIPTSVTTPNPNQRDFEEVYDGGEFMEIIERDNNLPNTPPTGVVPQDVEPDVEFTVTLDQGRTYLGQGIMYNGFLADGGIPGPTLRVQEGDIVRFNMRNEGTIDHGGSIHAAYAQTSGYIGKIPPGETRGVTFRATHPGVYMYHCAPGGHAIPVHVMAGQYGMIVVEPEEPYALEEELGQEPDLKMYVVQNELYASGADAVEGEDVAYSTYNGVPYRYVEDPIAVEPGDYVRMYYLNVGPSKLATHHIVGIIWDYAYWQGRPDAQRAGGQSLTAGPSDSWVVEFRIPPDEGVYTMLDHMVGDAARGAIALFAAEEGADGPDEILAEGPVYTQEELDEFEEESVRTIAPFEPGSEQLEYPEVYGPEVDEVVVEIKGNSFNAPVIEIEQGTTVTWRNEEVFTYLDGEFSGVHNAVATNGPEQFSIPLLAHGEKASVTFDTPGEYDYMCTPHPYMQGKIIVRPAEQQQEETSGCSSTSGSPAAPWALALLVLVGAAMVKRIEPLKERISAVRS